jgi:hypothetical protein
MPANTWRLAGQGETPVGRPVQRGHGRLAVPLGIHLDERDALAVGGRELVDHRHGPDGAVGGE